MNIPLIKSISNSKYLFGLSDQQTHTTIIDLKNSASASPYLKTLAGCIVELNERLNPYLFEVGSTIGLGYGLYEAAHHLTLPVMKLIVNPLETFLIKNKLREKEKNPGERLQQRAKTVRKIIGCLALARALTGPIGPNLAGVLVLTGISRGIFHHYHRRAKAFKQN